MKQKLPASKTETVDQEDYLGLSEEVESTIRRASQRRKWKSHKHSGKEGRVAYKVEGER